MFENAGLICLKLRHGQEEITSAYSTYYFEKIIMILFKPITQYHFDRKVIGIDGIAIFQGKCAIHDNIQLVIVTCSKGKVR
jgi:hypothetical protein